MMGRGLYGKLNDAMIREADWVAVKRTEDGNGRPTQRPDAAVIDVMGARCERAAKICFEPIVWHKFVADHELGNVPDLGDFIDVKGTNYAEPWLKVPAHKIKNHWAYLCVSAADHPYYWIAGWLWGHELAQQQHLKFPERPAFSVEVAQLHKPYLLQQIARERANGGA
jgi:hypothetical protein